MEKLLVLGSKLCASLVIVSFVLYQIHRILFGQLSHVPGPFLAKVSNFWMVKQTLDGRQHEIWSQLHTIYGL